MEATVLVFVSNVWMEVHVFHDLSLGRLKNKNKMEPFENGLLGRVSPFNNRDKTNIKMVHLDWVFGSTDKIL